jgi:UDP-N-acetylmuramate dehydrogenase
MAKLHTHINLKPYHTFGIDEISDALFEFETADELTDFIRTGKSTHFKQILPIGTGSNLLFTKKFEGCLLHCINKNIEIIDSNNEFVLVKTGAGIEWDDFVGWAVDEHLYGIENLSLIPGTTGATPVQNIGAYGVEIQDYIIEAEGIEIATGNKKTFKNKEIHFGYRDSVFKNELKDKYFIISVTFKLLKEAKINMSYGTVKDEVEKIGKPDLKTVRQAIINIRNSKLPDHKKIGNAGSFFKNPVVKANIVNDILKDQPDMPVYDADKGMKKLAAGWLIDQCGLKGFEMGNGAAVHDKQALVLINKSAETGRSIADLANFIREKVKNRFGIELEPEVKIL